MTNQYQRCKILKKFSVFKYSKYRNFFIFIQDNLCLNRLIDSGLMYMYVYIYICMYVCMYVCMSRDSELIAKIECYSYSYREIEFFPSKNTPCFYEIHISFVSISNPARASDFHWPGDL